MIGSCLVFPSRGFAEAPDPIEAFWDMIRGFMNGTGVEPQALRLISVGVPASVCGDLRTIFCAPNLKDTQGKLMFENYPFAERLERICGIPTLVNKDVNNLLCYDIHENDLKGIVVGCYIGTGVGGAVSIDGKLLLGQDGVAMDIRHLPLFHGLKRCGCGKRGCAESEIAGRVFLRLIKRCYPREDPSMAFVLHGNESVIESFVRDCAYVPAILATMFNPSALVLGGGVLEMEGFPKRMLEASILSQTANVVASKPPRFVYAERRPERGVIGAAIFARMAGVL